MLHAMAYRESLRIKNTYCTCAVAIFAGEVKRFRKIPVAWADSSIDRLKTFKHWMLRAKNINCKCNVLSG